MNLYERLKPEVKDKIDNYEYKAIASRLIDELKEKTNILDLSFGNVIPMFDINEGFIYEICITTLNDYFID